jgi:hypothetical protein
MSNVINVPGAPFDSSNSEFNGPSSFASVRTPHKPMHANAPAPGSSLSGKPAVVRTNFLQPGGSFVSNKGNVTAQYHRISLIGNFSAVRAVEVMHQFAVGFWSTLGAINLVSASNAADPSTVQIDQMWTDFNLFNYLPNSLTPSRADFVQMVAPSKAAAFITASLGSMGLNVSSTPASNTNNLLVTGQTVDSTTPFLTPQQPFVNSLGGNTFSNQPSLSRS